ncbi:hypothetical protein [Apibacter adventoris]|uniref:Uncharacterized protein n=1 Tax=Apibacter adventoris TaxID=1679466 RepID=A0A2S8A7L4_9FLAO|nr:hypothetical protein [Apibacter adventoris]PQL90567.1 hypothetical protein C4S77_11855 [Apibacter adventoris]
MKKNILLCLVLMILFSCQGQENKIVKNTNSRINDTLQNKLNMINIDLKKIEKHIKLQMNVTCGDVFDPAQEYTPTKEDLDLMLPLLEKSLFNSGYKIPDYSLFKQKIQEGFGVNIDKTKEDIIILYYNDSYNVLNDYVYGNTYNFCMSNLFIDKKRRIITPMIFLSDLIRINDSKTDNYAIKQNLKVLSLNKYLFYEDKASLTYLLSRDTDFTKELLICFGYDREEKINQLVLEELYNMYSTLGENYKLGEVVFVKNKKGEMKIHEGVLKTIANNTSENNNDWLYAINQFGYRIYSKNYKEEYEYKNQFTLEEKRKIVAYILNTYAPLYHKYIVKHEGKANWDPGSILENLCAEDNKLKDYIISQKYYGLPNLKAELAMTPCPWEPVDPD